jgi:magnesium-transporting ATPase (P-type)
MKILTIIIFTLLNISLAQHDANRIKKGKRIYHGINGAVYIVLLAIQHYIFADWYLTAALVFDRLLVFNIALSLYRSLPFDYISPEPKAITDKIAKRIFKKGIVMYGVYFAAFILLICKIFSWKL